MERTKVRKYQLAQLEILKYFDEKCAELNLDYYLVFGTLLGAIRHNGFIPWDADIDIAMFRRDYEALKDYFLSHSEPYLFYQHYETESCQLSPHAVLKVKGTHVYFKNSSSLRYKPKYDGIYIDIFPIDNVLSDEAKQMEQVYKIARLRRTVTLKAAPIYGKQTGIAKRIGKYFVSFILSPFSFKYLYSKADRIMQQYDSLETEKVAILTDPQVFKKQLFPREIFGKPRLVDFENCKFKIPQNAERFLEIRYGDFMRLPPEEERWKYLDNSIREIDYGDTAFYKQLKENIL